MTQKSPTIVFFGNERLATAVSTTAPTLQGLIDADYHVAAVVLNQEPAISRTSRRIEVTDVAASHNIPVLTPTKLTDITEQLESYQADIGVLVAYGRIVPESIINLFPAGIVNIHPSLLPKHRGSIPIESVLLNGEAETGVSLMRLVKAMDAGPVFEQRIISVPSGSSKQELTDNLLSLGASTLIEIIPSIIDGSLVPQPQDESQATYDNLITKADGIIDWTKPAVRLEREIRAYQGWPKSIAQIGHHQVILTGADVVPTSGLPGNYQASKTELIIHCGVDSLQITRLQPVNKKEMPVGAFLAGHRL
jgi:methionyl-tRNA formyltransferase